MDSLGQAAQMQSSSSKSTLISRNVTVLRKRTSVRLEPEMWHALKEIADRESCTIHDLCSLISLRKKPDTSLTAAIRVFLMMYFRAASTEEGHNKAGHGSIESMKKRIGLSRADVEEASLTDSVSEPTCLSAAHG